MGGKRCRASPEQPLARAVKQLKMDEFVTANCPVSNLATLPIASSILTNNRFALLREEILSSPPGACDLSAISTPCTPLTPQKIQFPSESNHAKFLAEQCLLTAQTVIAIFDNLQRVCNQMNSVESALGKLTETLLQPKDNTQTRGFKEKADGRFSHKDDIQQLAPQQLASQLNRETKSSKVFQSTQVMLQIAPIAINRKRWETHRSVMISLSQLLNIEVRKIDLKNIRWLPHKYGHKRVCLTFEHAVIPLILLKMRTFLGKFQITPSRVFSEPSTLPPLWSRPTSLIPGSNPQRVTREDFNFRSDSNAGKSIRVQLKNSMISPLSDHRSSLCNTEETQAPLIDLNNKWEEVKASVASVCNKTIPLRSYLTTDDSGLQAKAAPLNQYPTASNDNSLIQEPKRDLKHQMVPHQDIPVLITLDGEETENNKGHLMHGASSRKSFDSELRTLATLEKDTTSQLSPVKTAAQPTLPQHSTIQSADMHRSGTTDMATPFNLNTQDPSLSPDLMD